jgi:hypothetical protein
MLGSLPITKNLIFLRCISIYPVYNSFRIAIENNQKKQEEFRKTFSDLADKIIALTSTSTYAVSA